MGRLICTTLCFFLFTCETMHIPVDSRTSFEKRKDWLIKYNWINSPLSSFILDFTEDSFEFGYGSVQTWHYRGNYHYGSSCESVHPIWCFQLAHAMHE